MNGKKFAIAAVAIAAALSAGWAEARGRDDVQWSVTVGSTNPAPWVAAPVQLYRQAPAVVWDGRSHERRFEGRTRPTRWDRDGDGIPNRYDRVYSPRWDRDGDGIPNRHDRDDDRRHRHDGR